MKSDQDQKRKGGQVILEYVVALGVFIAMLGICGFLLYAFKAYGGRVLALVAYY